MIKRTFIVIAVLMGIVFVPYFIGVWMDGFIMDNMFLGEKKTNSQIWASGCINIMIITGTSGVSFFVAAAIIDYIKGE